LPGPCPNIPDGVTANGEIVYSSRKEKFVPEKSKDIKRIDTD
jgi:hypothetical protein